VSKRVLVIVGAILLLAGVAAACSDTADLEDRIDALEQQQASFGEAGQRASMLVALHALREVGLHALETEGQLEPEVGGKVDVAILAVAAASWPSELQASADDVQAKLHALALALDDGDPAAVTPAAKEAHTAWHMFDADASSFLAAAVGLETDGGGGDNGTPDSGMDHSGGG